MEIFSEIIISLQTLHDCIYTEEREKRNRDIKKLHENYVKIIREKKKAKTQEERRKIDEERKEIEREAVNRIEARDTAAQMRIEHFYRNEIGKLKPATFRCTREKTRSRKIRKLEFEGEEKTNEDEIAEIMDRWYQETANKEQEQTETLQAFLEKNRIRLPKITDEERDEMEKEITREEVEEALRDAKTNTAPGPTGQTITYYRLLYQEIPDIFTEAINQLTFQTEQGSSEYLTWIRNRKVVYIPKKEDPKSPGDYRPLSMLETLYKVPARILAKRLIRILPGIIGEHQHGFMPGKGIQEPIMLATHQIEDAKRSNRGIQIVTFDIEKAFDRTSHKIIIESMREFGIPEIFIEAIKNLALQGIAQIEVNERIGQQFKVRTGTGQGCPMSAPLFTIATEPLNRAIKALHEDKFYTLTTGRKVGPRMYADDNLTALNMRTGREVKEILGTYSEYTKVSGLNVNANKSKIVCYRTSREIEIEIERTGIQIVENIEYLGIIIGRHIVTGKQIGRAHV